MGTSDALNFYPTKYKFGKPNPELVNQIHIYNIKYEFWITKSEFGLPLDLVGYNLQWGAHEFKIYCLKPALLIHKFTALHFKELKTFFLVNTFPLKF